MKTLIIPCFFFSCIIARATGKDSTIFYSLPDTIKAVQFMGEISVTALTGSNEVFAGIKTELVKLSLESDKNERTVVFEFPNTANVIATGINTDASEKGEMEWKYNWNMNEPYRLLISSAVDSAADLSLYSAYIFLPNENKWKLIGSCKIIGRSNTIQQPAFFYTTNKMKSMLATCWQVWCQNWKGEWINLNDRKTPVPMIDLAGHADSLQEHQKEMKLIANTFTRDKNDIINYSDQLYYHIIKEGTGRQVRVDDTVTVYYKLTLLNDNTVIDETKDAPMTFSLNWLIKGWQIGVPLCKVGGKIKLLLPSDLAYSIQNLSVRIPPNSILVYEIEVVDCISAH
jgi:FKBP-type peptidyl-prolyl cis-trans isomerase FkpA